MVDRVVSATLDPAQFSSCPLNCKWICIDCLHIRSNSHPRRIIEGLGMLAMMQLGDLLDGSLVVRILKKLQRERKRKGVMRHKDLLSQARLLYTAYPQVAFVFQTFNKGSYAGQVLSPFLDKSCSNIIVFADGCIDKSAVAWHEKLMGRNHIVIAANDLHEIRNYRLALKIADHWGCSHVVLLQDDDIFDSTIFDWLDAALSASNSLNVAIVGGNGGHDIDLDFQYRYADAGVQFAEFVSSTDKSGIEYDQLGSYYRMLRVKSLHLHQDASSALRFCCSVNRSPQLVRVDLALSLDFFPEELEPYQYDDFFNCFQSWLQGYSVLHLPGLKRGWNESGGMRLYNNVNASSRPPHFSANWNFIMHKFSDNFKEINDLVQSANASILK